MGLLGPPKGSVVLSAKRQKQLETALLKEKVAQKLKEKQKSNTGKKEYQSARGAAPSSAPASGSLDNNNNNGAAFAYQPAHINAPTVYFDAPPQMTATSRFGNGASTTTINPSSSSSASSSSYNPYTIPSSPPIAVEHAEDCICTICNCGRHHCPPTPKINASDPAMYNSENHDRFRGSFAPAQRVVPPRQQNWKGPAFDGNSNYREDYIKHPIIPTQQARTSAMLHDTGVGRGGAPFDGRTTNQSDYKDHGLQERPPRFQMENNLRSRGPENRNFLTENRDMYDKKPIELTGPSMPRGASTGIDPSIPFEGTTTHKSDYIPHPGARAAIPTIINNLSQLLPEDRDFRSEHRQVYTPKKNNPCPAAPLAVPFKLKSGHIYVEKIAPETYRYKQGILAKTGAPSARLGLNSL